MSQDIEPKKERISTLGSQITTVISVTLVLIILGLLGISILAASNVGADIRSNIAFIVKADPGASEDELNGIRDRISQCPGAADISFTSADDILLQESRLMGEDFTALLDENPFGAEFEVKIAPGYTTTDSIAQMTSFIDSGAAVAEIVTQNAVIDSINSALGRISLVLIIVGAALLVISFVLINNTVSLAIYSRRFIIHTMKLVGATPGFIRWPFVKAGLITGLIAALISITILWAMRAYALTLDPAVGIYVTTPDLAIISLLMLVCGLAICGLAAVMATNRYLKADYEEMFK